MSLLEKYHKRFREKNPIYRYVMIGYYKIPFPFFKDIKFADVTRFFIDKLGKEHVSIKGAAIAFNVFLSVFPAFIFLFTMIPYLPIPDAEEYIMHFFQTMMPENAYFTINETLQDIIGTKRGSLLSIGFITALYFASSSVSVLIDIFNEDVRISFIKGKLRAIIMTLLLGALFILYLVLLVLGQATIEFILEFLHIYDNFIATILILVQWIFMFALIFVSYIIMYYFGEFKKHKLKYIIPGAILATLLTTLTSLGYAFYVNNFGNYNKLYGSLGALVITMLWLNYNAMIVIICHEFNNSLRSTSPLEVEE